VKQGNPSGSEVTQYIQTLKLYFEFFSRWRCTNWMV